MLSVVVFCTGWLSCNNNNNHLLIIQVIILENKNTRIRTGNRIVKYNNNIIKEINMQSGAKARKFHYQLTSGFAGSFDSTG